MAREKVRLTKTVVEAAEPQQREYVLWDNRLRGFGLRVRPSGSRSFIYAYRTAGGRAGAYRRDTIKATHPDVAYVRARELAGQYLRGGDPVGEKAEQRAELQRARDALTVGEVLDRFIEDHAKPELAPKTAAEYERIVEKALKPQIGATAVNELKPTAVAALRDRMRSTPTQANLTVRVLSSAMSWAEEAGLRSPGPNPARIRLKGTRRRQRLFSASEVWRLQATIDRLEADNSLSPIVALGLRLLFATGCRAGEICALRWSNVDRGEGLMRWPNSKTGYLEKPITSEAAKLLKGAPRIVGVDWVCPSSKPDKPMRVETLEAGFEKVMREAKVEARENATLHLIRHWFATKIYTDKSIPLPTQMAIVGHSSVATAMRYAHVDREEMKKAAQEASRRRHREIRSASKGGKIVKLESKR